MEATEYRKNLPKKGLPKFVPYIRPFEVEEKPLPRCPRCLKERHVHRPATALCAGCITAIDRELKTRI